MTQPTNSLFQPNHPNQAVATLILVENSQNMSYLWPDLRDRYLNKLVDSLVSSNQSVPITVSVLESHPCQDPGSNFLPRQYSGYHDGLHELRFNVSQENRLSVGLISGCVDFLNSGKFQGQPTTRHIIIVAATTPSDDPGSNFPNNGPSPWSSLAQKLANNNIHCHIAVTMNQDMSSLKILFEETLRLQNNIEEMAPFPVENNSMLFRFSAKPSYQHYADPRGTPYQPQPSIPRRNSYPLDNFYPESVEDLSSSTTSLPGDSPSLVSQLQQVHGLIKKKVYGTKPPRQPFFREERVREKHCSIPAPLTMPMAAPEQIPSPTAGGRVLSQSRADRIARVNQNSPTDLHPRRQFGWPRRGSRLSTPEPDNKSSPPSSSSNHDMSPPTPYSSEFPSPVTPVMPMDDMYGVSPGLPLQTQAGLQNSLLASYQSGGIPDPSWTAQPQYDGGYPAPYFPPPSQQHLYCTNDQMVVDSQIQQQNQRPSVYPTPASNPHNSYGSFITSPPTLPSQAPREIEPPAPAPPIKTAVHTKSSSRAKKPAPVDNDEQVTFSKDFVAATAALFEEEVLPAYPNFGLSSGLTGSADHEIPAHMPASRGGELYASRPKTRAALAKDASAKAKGSQQMSSALHYSYNQPMAGYNPSSLQYGSNYLPAGGSSLTGWAG